MKTKQHGGKRKGAGRKTGPSGKLSARIHVKCLPSELAAIKRTARAIGMSQSDWIRFKLGLPVMQ